MKNKKGFTIVELMIVVVIFAILVAIAVPIYKSVTTTYGESKNTSTINISSKPTAEKPRTENIKNNESDILQTTYEYDTYGNIIEKSVYNPETKITTNYFYIYKDNEYLSEVQITTISETGEIIDFYRLN